MIVDTTFGSVTSLYKYVSIFALERILEGSVKFTQPSGFNDPFELLPAVAVPLDYRDKKPGMLELSWDCSARRRHNPSGVLEQVPNDCEVNDGLSRDIVKELNEIIGIFCLSRIHDSPLMWSHYADQYAGAVVEFDGSHAFFDGKIEVEYSDSRPLRSIDYYTSSEPVPISELCVKSKDWEYESEVRLICKLKYCNKSTNLRGGLPVYTRHIPNECIKSIIIGQRTPLDIRKNIYASVKDSNCGLYIASIDHADYRLWINEVKSRAPEMEAPIILTPHNAPIFKDEQTLRGEEARDIIGKHRLSRLISKPV